MPSRPPAKMLEVIVIGGGPAGLAAGMHLSRAGYRTLLLEKDDLGGQAKRIDWIENYPGFPAGIKGRDLMALWTAQARGWGLKVLRSEARSVARLGTSFKVVPREGPALRSRSMLCCAGAQFKRLGVAREEELRGRGVHHAAFENAEHFRNRTVAVAGSGEAAVHQALLLSKFARRVYLIGRGPRVKAHRLLQGRLRRRTNIAHLPNASVTGLEGRDKLERVVIRESPAGSRRTLEVSGLFVLIGKRRSSLASGARGWPGFFAAGDASGAACRQVVVAAGRGVEAAARCIRYLEQRNVRRP